MAFFWRNLALLRSDAVNSFIFEAARLKNAYRTVREQSRHLSAPLSAEDACVQPALEASPAKWNLAHTTWFFETFLLERWEKPFKPFHPSYRILFNSYYNGVGEKHPRARRGMLTRPSLEEVWAYRNAVDERLLALSDQIWEEPEFIKLCTLGMNHEEQHQELLLTDIKFLLFQNPLLPAYHNIPLPVSPAAPQRWIASEGGLQTIGFKGEGFCFDNEGPRHRVFLEPFDVSSRLVTNGEFAEFVHEGGYQNPSLWLAEGWDWVKSQERKNPLYWQKKEGAWFEFTLAGLVPLDFERPVVHVSYFEAEAFARWAGVRLPSEFEWETVGAQYEQEGHFADRGVFHPTAEGAESHKPLGNFLGNTWVWTSSSYAPYPGFQTAEGAVGEYNGKFMVNQYVLRGGSCVSPVDHLRVTYRNFFPSWAAWQFTGIRLARDLR